LEEQKIMATQYRSTVAEIDLARLRENLRLIRTRLPERTQVIGVVKADAYGHGAVQVATVLEQEHVQLLAVATAEEAVELREHGIKAGVLVLGRVPADFVPYAVAHSVILSTPDYATTVAYGAAARPGVVQLHFKTDSGMGRWGTLAGQTVTEVIKSAAVPGVQISGMYSHFASAETDAAFTTLQAERFASAVTAVRAHGIAIGMAHIANSAAILTRSDVFWNAVRPGIILYGYPPVPAQDCPVRPILSLRSTVDMVRDLPEGYSVGYGRTFVTPRPMRMALIPVGYADGYLRGLSNKAHVIIRGRYAPVVGRISMDVFSADVTDIPGTTAGDPVTLIGEQDGLTVSAEDLAILLNTISYEVLTGITRRVPRVYRDASGK